MRALRFFFFFLAAAALAQGAADPGLSFTQNAYSYVASINHPFSLKLSSLLGRYEKQKPVRWVSSQLPPWIELDGHRGILSGQTPEEYGKHSFWVQARQGKTLVRAEVALAVKRDAFWKGALIDLGKAMVGRPFKMNLRKLVENLDAREIRMRVTGLPNWLKFDDKKGVLGGTPLEKDLGNRDGIRLHLYGKKEAVSVGHLYVVAGSPSEAKGKSSSPRIARASKAKRVAGTGAAPVWLKELVDLPNAVVREIYSFDLSKEAVDREGDTIVFSLVKAPTWLKISSKGMLSGTPPGAGDFTAVVEASDGTSFSQAGLRGKVVAGPVGVGRVPVWTTTTIRFFATQGVAFSASLAGKVQDPDGGKLTFSKKNIPGKMGPAWLGITEDGDLFGTPTGGIGERTLLITAANESKSADATLIMTVVAGNSPPKWKSDPMRLPPGRVLQDYAADLGPLVGDPDGDPVTFSKIGDPKWVLVASDGKVTGKPRAGDAGPNSVRVVAMDSHGACAEATVQINVVEAKTAPAWTSDPLELGAVQIGKAIALDLKPLVIEEDGDPLTFKKIKGPAWLLLDSLGKLSGAPTTADKLGSFVAVFEVTDGTTPVQAGATGTVVTKNNPPVILPLTFKMDERKVLKLNISQTDYVSDPDGDVLRFSMSPVSWAELTTEGILTVHPGYGQVGSQILEFDVTDSKDKVHGQIKVTVVRVPRSPQWKEDPIALNGTAGVPFRGSVDAKAEDLDGIALIFSKKSGPAWLKVDARGRLSGLPSDSDAGENSFVLTATNDKLGADAAIVIQVASDNSPPVWRQRPVLLSNAKSGKRYSQSLKPFAMDPDPEETLTFERILDPKSTTEPSWPLVTTGGLIFGYPDESDVGPNLLTVRVRDSHGAFADARIQITVDSKNNPPRWIQIPVKLGNAKVGVAYSFHLGAWAEDADGDVLTFRKADGPAWLLVSGEGAVGGKPKESDAGPFTATFEVTDGKAAVSVDASGQVLGANKPPVINQDSLTFTVAGGQTREIELNNDAYVKDPEGEPMTFQLLSSAPWATCTEEGKLTLSPPAGKSTTVSFKLRVTDGSGAFADGTISVKVDNDVREPVFLREVIALNAKVDSLFSADLNDYAKDLAGYPLTFAKVSGPDWLAINSNGKMTGRPTAAMVGAAQEFQVTAANQTKTSAPATVVITVQTAVSRDVYGFDRPEKNARAEILFLVDHTSESSTYYEDFKRSASGFFSALDKATVQYSAAVLSSRSFLGSTAMGYSGSARVTNYDGNPASELGRMVDQAKSDADFQSPIWALTKFFARVPTGTGYKNEYYNEEVPLFVFIHVSHKDDFDVLKKGTVEETSDSKKMALRFARWHETKHKPFQVYVNDMTCDSAARKVYQQLANATRGQVIASTPCLPPFGDWMSSFADVVVTHSARYNKRLFELRRQPRDLSKLKVSIRYGGKAYALKGDRDSEYDKWHYDEATRCIVLHWWNIHMPYNPETDELVVEY